MFYIHNGRRSNDVAAFSSYWWFVIPYYVFCPWSKTSCCRESKYFAGSIGISIHDIIWSWTTWVNKQEFILMNIIRIIVIIYIQTRIYRHRNISCSIVTYLYEPASKNALTSASYSCINRFTFLANTHNDIPDGVVMILY